MVISQKILIAAVGLLLSGLGSAQPSVPKDYLSLGLDLILDPDSTEHDRKNLGDEWIQNQLNALAHDRQQTAEHRYLAASAFVRASWTYGRILEIQNLCQELPPRADDFHYRGICLRHGNGDISEAAAQIETLAREVFELYPTSSAAADIMRFAGDMLSSKGRLHEGIMSYRKIFSVIPPDSPAMMIDAKLNLAFAYGSALNSKILQLQSAAYYAEIRTWYQTHLELPMSEERILWLSYNRAIGQIFLFQNYEEALKDLTIALPHKRLNLDAQVFSAYVLAHLGRREESIARLALVDLNRKADLKRRAFLSCYVDLTKRILYRTGSVQSCLNLESPQTDVLLDLTRTMSGMNLPEAEENLLWRKFYAFYAQHLLPDIQETLESVSTSAELEKSRVEGRFKDLQLKNLGLFQNLALALSGIAALLVVAVLMALWFWRNIREERGRLQNILDNIDEGIVRIQSGLILAPEDSSHFRLLMGGVDLHGVHLKVLLDMFQLADSQKEMIRECLNASLGENAIAWDLNHMNLPDEVAFGDKSLVCFWQPILRDGVIESVLLVMHDVTSMAELKKTSLQAREEADQLLQYAREILSKHPRAASQFVKECPGNLQSILKFLKSEDTMGAMRLTHTLKGAARSLGLIPLHERIHELEDDIRKTQLANAQDRIHSLQNQVQIYAKAITQLIGGGHETEVANVFDIVAILKPGLCDLLAAAQIPLRGIRVHEEAELDANELRAVHQILLHALTNAADHGYILPARKGQRLPSAFFAIELLSSSHKRTLTIRDQGVGIDYETIKTLAAAAHWQPTSDQKWTDFLFRDGVSTLQDVSLTSGRGVGLAAIREALSPWQGRVELIDNDQSQGSLLVLQWSNVKSQAA